MKLAAIATCLISAAVASPVPGQKDAASPTELVTIVQSTPTSVPYSWSEGWQSSYPIHSSCNSTLKRQLEDALEEVVELAQHARNHILRFGNKSEFVQKYFGNSSAAEAIGWYDRVVAADKGAMTFRCDDPDKNCATQNNWAGHWRGSNATTETVICPRSFEVRRPLNSVCNLGYTVAGSPLNTIWAVDLLHRVLHVPTISEEVVDHHADDYESVLALAKEDPKKSVEDSNALQYFAIDVWAYDIAAPGVGCTGKPDPDAKKKKQSHATPTKTDAPTNTADAGKECHTHADGALHCV